MKRWWWECSLIENTICLPPGDQAGLIFCPGPVVTRRSRFPPVPIVSMLKWPLRLVSNAILDPSGDQAGLSSFLTLGTA
jgi:hypothetical protein